MYVFAFLSEKALEEERNEVATIIARHTKMREHFMNQIENADHATRDVQVALEAERMKTEGD